jgi:hypothetical protein
MRSVKLIAALCVFQAVASASIAGELGGRFFFYSDSQDTLAPSPFHSATSASASVALTPHLPVSGVGWKFDDQRYLTMGWMFDGNANRHTNCVLNCDAHAPVVARGLVGFSDATRLVYLTAGVGLNSPGRSGWREFTTVGVVSEKWTFGVGVSYRLSPGVQLWGQLDQFALDCAGPCLNPALSGFNSYETIGRIGITMPFFAGSAGGNADRLLVIGSSGSQCSLVERIKQFFSGPCDYTGPK